MNYNKRNPIFSFRLSDYRKSKLDKLALLDKMSTNEFARKIIDMFLANELIEKTEDLDVELLKLKIEKIRADIEYQKMKINYMINFNKPMSASATRIIKPQIIVEPRSKTIQTFKDIYENPQSPYDAKNKRLQCIDCGCLFSWSSNESFNSQMQEFQRHLVAKHNRIKTAIEKEVLIDLVYEGAST
jgi:hypothetical protein